MIFTVKGDVRFEILFKVHEELGFEYLGSVNLSGVTLQEYRFSVLYMDDLYSSRYFSRYIFFYSIKRPGVRIRVSPSLDTSDLSKALSPKS